MHSLQCAIDAVWLPGGRHQSSQRVAGGDDAPPRAVAIFHVAHPQLIARNHSKSNAAIVARRMHDAADEVCEHDSGPPE